MMVMLAPSAATVVAPLPRFLARAVPCAITAADRTEPSAPLMRAARASPVRFTNRGSTPAVAVAILVPRFYREPRLGRWAGTAAEHIGISHPVRQFAALPVEIPLTVCNHQLAIHGAPVVFRAFGQQVHRIASYPKLC